jgi:PEGA domain
MNKPLLIASFGLLIMLGSGCSTTGVKTTQKEDTGYGIRVNSTPTDAAIYLDNDYQGVTPLTVGLKEETQTLTLFKPGYAPVETQVQRAKNQSFDYTLIPVNRYLYDLINSKGIRFVKRSNLNDVRIEPSNRTIGVNYAFYMKDDGTGKVLRLRIAKLAAKYVLLETEDGTSVVMPILYIEDNR